jgi:hypothetical protein
MPERTYRSGMEAIPGHVAAGKLLNANGGKAAAAFKALGIIDIETADDYLTDLAVAALKKPDYGDRISAICEVAELFALTMVMGDREQRRED